jgi:alpha-tubulin suppressor-like RCC1 family protein
LVGDLEDLPTGRIVKVAAGGYLIAALTSGNDLYCWGGHPGRPPLIDDLTGFPSPVVIEDNDIVDVAVGDFHVIALTEARQVFVTGENTNGQLGLDVECAKVWTPVHLNLKPHQEITGVAAGPRASFVTVRTDLE